MIYFQIHTQYTDLVTTTMGKLPIISRISPPDHYIHHANVHTYLLAPYIYIYVYMYLVLVCWLNVSYIAKVASHASPHPAFSMLHASKAGGPGI